MYERIRLPKSIIIVKELNSIHALNVCLKQN